MLRGIIANFPIFITEIVVGCIHNWGTNMQYMICLWVSRWFGELEEGFMDMIAMQ